MTEPTAILTPEPKVTYWAISILSSRTFWLNVAALIVAVLTAADVMPVIPKAWTPIEGALVAVLNVYLRTQTVRPVAFIAPGNTAPVTVAKLPTTPPTVPVITD